MVSAAVSSRSYLCTEKAIKGIEEMVLSYAGDIGSNFRDFFCAKVKEDHPKCRFATIPDADREAEKRKSPVIPIYELMTSLSS